MAFYQLRNQFVFGDMLGCMSSLRFQSFADFFSYLVKIGKVAQLFCKSFVQFGKILLLERVHHNGIGESLSRKTLVGRVLRIRYLEGSLVARRCAAQILCELRHRRLARNLHQNVIHVYRLGLCHARL